jgi:hypothetical protein
MQRAQKQNGESENAQRTAQAKFTSKSREAEQANSIDDSPAMIAQRKKLQSLFGGAIQRVEDEAPLQGKFDAVQRVEEAEPLQGKFETTQRVEEEEPLQGKFETAQRVEEEEPLQGKFETVQRVEEEEPLQGKFEAVQRVEDEEPLQGKFEAASSTQLKEEVAKPNNTGLPDNLKSGIENLSGMSMDNVKVHYNSSQPAQLNALAYAQGTDIHVAPGQEQHLPHEAWHVVQQAQGRVKPTMQMKEGVPVNDDHSLEHEADVMGGKALSVGQRVVQKVDGIDNSKRGCVPHLDSSSAPATVMQAAGVVLQRVKTKTVGGITVTTDDTGGYPTWDMDDGKWHINWALGEKKKGREIYHVTKEASPKIHYFFSLSGSEISDEVAPKGMGGAKGTKQKFSKLPNTVKQFIQTNISQLL